MRQNKATGVPLDDYIPYRFAVIAEAMSRRLARQYSERYGLKQTEWRVLHVLSEDGPMTTQDMIARANLDRVRASRAAAALEDKGLLARVTHPQDRRAHLLQLTPRGLKLFGEIEPVTAEVQDFLLAALDPGERVALRSILEKLTGVLAVDGDVLLSRRD